VAKIKTLQQRLRAQQNDKHTRKNKRTGIICSDNLHTERRESGKQQENPKQQQQQHAYPRSEDQMRMPQCFNIK